MVWPGHELELTELPLLTGATLGRTVGRDGVTGRLCLPQAQGTATQGRPAQRTPTPPSPSPLTPVPTCPCPACHTPATVLMGPAQGTGTAGHTLWSAKVRTV